MVYKTISLGGSLIWRDDGINTEYYTRFCELLKRSGHDDIRYIIVVGGGQLARQVIRAGKDFDLEPDELDELGIDATHFNAKLLYYLLRKSGIAAYYSEHPDRETKGSIEMNRVIVVGGTTHGHTTDEVAVQMAHKYGDNTVVNVTKAGGVYTEDPSTHPNATILEVARASDLLDKWGREHVPGENKPFGVAALEKALEYRSTIHVVGERIEDLEKALFEGYGYKGTKIIPY